MAEITAAMVKELRERTQAGMMDCKKALVASDGNMDKAVEYLREKGLAAVAKKAGRVASEGMVDSYIHMGGKIGVLVNMTGGDEQLGKDIAMQIAAAAPMAVDRDGVDASALEHEKEVLRKQAEEEGKPANIIERMVEGRINKFYKEVCLNEQIFVKDSEKTIKDVLGDVKVTEFTRFQLGEGIEKKQDDFAAEVAAQLK
jgi:elongation factor Ts